MAVIVANDKTERPLFLSGNYELTLDEKHRMLIPSEVRKQLVPERDGDGFFCLPGADARPWFYPERPYEALVNQEPAVLSPSFSALSRDRASSGMAIRIWWDKQGRILIPEQYLEAAEIKRDVTLVGVRDHLELWNTADWKAECKIYLDEKREADKKAREQRQNPPAAPLQSGQAT